MSFEQYEASVAASRPLRLYLFQRGSSLYWAYTNADRDIEHGGYTYKKAAISDDGIRQSGEPDNDVLKVRVPIDNDVAALFKATQPSDEIELTVRDVDWQDIDNSLVVWVGSVASISMPKEAAAEINCISLISSLDQVALKRTYNRNCDYAIFNKSCGLNKAAFAISGTITAINGATLTCNFLAQPTRSLAYGFIEWSVSNGAAFESRGIDGASGNQVTLIGGAGGLKVGQAITLYPGCDQSSATCKNVFNNFINYGGFRHIPGKSPFDGTPID